MAFIHGKNVSFTLDDVDLSAFANSVKVDRKSDSHDVTTYGKTSKVYAGGLLDASIDIEGNYDDGATGPGKTIRPLIGTVVTFIYAPEGDATGKPTVTGSCLVVGYTETDPVAGMITWAASLQCSDDLTDGTVAA